MQLYKKSLSELKKMLANKEVTSKEITNSYIERIEATDKKINGYLTRTFENAVKQASAADKLIESGEAKNLTGIPYALKDNICTKDIRTTCSSKLLENFVPPYSATVYNKLNEDGAVLLGKVDMDEFAMGSSNENSAFAEVKNPWDLERIPGGSSGASAAVTAADAATFTLGTDTGGSIRCPAAYCNVTGLKPTYGRVSRYGAVAFASSFDQIGTLSKDIEDAALILNSIAGYDENDSTSMNINVEDYTKYLKEDIQGLKIGIDWELLNHDGVSEDIKEATCKAIDTFKSMGAEIVDVHYSYNDYVIPTYYLISSAEASSNLSRFDGVRFGERADGNSVDEVITNTRTKYFGDEVKRRILIGTYALSAGYYDMYYSKAMKVRRLIKNEFDKNFEKCDLLLTPTTPDTAYKIGEKCDDPVSMYLYDRYTVTANLCGNPSVSIPAGFDKNGLPIGLQLTASAFKEGTLIKAGYNFQLATKYHKERPNV